MNCECGKDKHGFASHSDWCPVHPDKVSVGSGPALTSMEGLKSGAAIKFMLRESYKNLLTTGEAAVHVGEDVKVTGLSAWLPEADKKPTIVKGLLMSVNRTTGEILIKLHNIEDHPNLNVGMILDMEQEE